MISLPGRIPLTVQPSFWLLAMLLGWLMGQTFERFIMWVVVLFVSLLVHELGHALTARLWGQRARIELYLLGGVTIREGRALSKAREFVIVLMGPLFGFVLAAAAYLLLKTVPTKGNLTYFLLITSWANVFWNVLNLLPIHPLDGGRLMAIVCDALFGLAGVRFSYLLSALFGIAASAFFIVTGSVIVGALFLLCAFESFRSWQSARVFRTGGGDEQFLSELNKAQFDWEHHQPERAIQRLEELVTRLGKGEVFFRALELLTGYLLVSGQTQKAYTRLLPLKNSLEGELLKQFQLASYKLGQWELGLDAGKKVFADIQDVSCAILNAFCSAHLGRVSDAVNWLRFVQNTRAVDMTPILSAEDLDEIRQDPLFTSSFK